MVAIVPSDVFDEWVVPEYIDEAVIVVDDTVNVPVDTISSSVNIAYNLETSISCLNVE